MAVSKADVFDARDADLALAFKALGHPARIAILRLLVEQGTCICGEIVEQVPLAQATVSQHLRVLKRAGLIVGEIEGPSVCYCVDAGALRVLKESANTLFQSLNSTCCKSHE